MKRECVFLYFRARQIVRLHEKLSIRGKNGNEIFKGE